MSVKIKKKHHVCEKDFIWNTATCSCENGKYVISITSDLVITCVEILEATKNFPIKSTSTKTVPTRNSIYNYILFTFLLNTIALLIAVKIYYYLLHY